MCEHAFYDRSTHLQYMRSSTKVVGILRHPLDQLRSSIAFHGLKQPMRLSNADPVAQFLSDPATYDARAHFVGSSRGCGPMLKPSFTQNHLAFHFGYANQSDNSDVSVERFLSHLRREVDVMLLLERFDESLVLLRRTFNWKVKDIVYLPLFTADSTGKKIASRERSVTSQQRLLDAHRAWSRVDYAMYEHYKDAFEQLITQQSSDFTREVAHLQNVNIRLRRHCASMCKEPFLRKVRFLKDAPLLYNLLTSHWIEIEATEWSDAFKLDFVDCLSTMMSTLHYQEAIRQLQVSNRCSVVRGGEEGSRGSCNHLSDTVFYTFTRTALDRVVLKNSETCLKHLP